MKFLFSLFLICGGMFLFTRLGLNSYNIELSQANRALTNEIEAARNSIDQLQIEINILQEKTQILESLDNQLSTNYGNIFVIEE